MTTVVGASNALAAFVKYAGKVPPQSMVVLLYMAVVSKDSDKHPWYGQGHEALAQHALGRPGPTTGADLRAVERAVEPLLGDALIVDRRAAIRIDGPNTVRYRLNLMGDAHARRKPSGVKALEDPPRPTESDPHARRFSTSRPTVSGTHARRKPSDIGDTRRRRRKKWSLLLRILRLWPRSLLSTNPNFLRCHLSAHTVSPPAASPPANRRARSVDTPPRCSPTRRT